MGQGLACLQLRQSAMQSAERRLAVSALGNDLGYHGVIMHSDLSMSREWILRIEHTDAATL
jgi:hypothetical protein